jgi:GntR family transcriptional repressor for pyruvate dehydrogenase complex
MAEAELNRSQLSVLRAGLSGYLNQQILELIRNEGLQRGDRLPSVRALAERFSVATPTLREALRRLQANGVLEIRHGSGVYVRDPRERAVIANPGHGYVNLGTTILDLLDARLLIEPRLAELTVRRADEAKVAELERLLGEAERRLDGAAEMLHRANMSFHRAIAEFSGNSILAQIIESLIELYSFEQLAIMSFYDDRLRDHGEHLEILAAIRDGDAEHARGLMHRHISGVRSTVEARMVDSGLGDGRRD